MSIMGTITGAIFGQAREARQATQARSGGLGAGAAETQGAGLGGAMPQMGQPAAAGSQGVDVEAALTQIAEGKGNPDLNWRKSIVDLMKLLDLDSSLDNRKALADELGYSGEKDGSAEMNIWLHRKVMEELEKNGGRVPATMKD